MTVRARALRRLRAGRSPAAVIEMPPLVISPEPASGPKIDLEEVGRMYAEDMEKNPGHWK